MKPSSANPALYHSRIDSMDVFRGLTVLVMVFVDNLSFVRGLPWWTYHMPPNANGMTYVDMVFPAFLFLVGMSVPLAIARRMAQGAPAPRIWAHILFRSLSLVALGLFISNAPQLDPAKAGIGAVTWALLGFVAIVLVWHVDPSRGRHRVWHRVLQGAGLALWAGLAIFFRRIDAGGHVAWLDFSDWEILGLIGWAYLLVSAVYFRFRQNIWALAGAFVAFVTVNGLSSAGWLHGLERFPFYLRPFEAGLASIAMAGVLTAMILFTDMVATTFKRKALWAIGLAAVLAAGGLALTPLGISKLRDTPSWCLYCSAANILIILILYWLIDVKRQTDLNRKTDVNRRWVNVIRPVGTNPLLAYLLAYVAYFTPRLGFLTADGSAGWPGVAKAFFFTALVFGVCSILTRMWLRLQL